MEEITYLNAPGATVTSTRIAIGAQTFATRNVGSVAIETAKKPSWPLWVGIIGAFMVVGTWRDFGAATIMGVVMLAAAGAVMFKPASLTLKLHAGGGEIIALQSTDKAAIQALHDAIVQAISAR
jgi:hypothetical protein